MGSHASRDTLAHRRCGTCRAHRDIRLFIPISSRRLLPLWPSAAHTLCTKLIRLQLDIIVFLGEVLPAHQTQVSGALTTRGSRMRYSRGCWAAAAQGMNGWKGPLTSTLSTSSPNADVRYERGLGVVSQLRPRQRQAWA